MTEQNTPIEEVAEMLQRGISSEQVVTTLQERGYANEDIRNALSMATTKASVEAPIENQIEPPAPGMQPSMLSQDSMDAPTIPAPPVPQPTMQLQGTVQQPSFSQVAPSRDMEERIEEISEAIINEKWHRVVEEVGDLGVWKEKVSTDITSVKQEVLRIQNRFESLQNTVLGRVKDYDKSIDEVGSDIRAIEKLLKEILNPLTTNVKELKEIVKELKR